MIRTECRELWESRIAEYKASRQGVTAWCEEHNVNPQQLYYWLKKENKQTISETSLMWLPLEIDNKEAQSSLLITVGQVAIEVKAGFDPKLLLDVVNTLVAQ